MAGKKSSELLLELGALGIPLDSIEVDESRVDELVAPLSLDTLRENEEFKKKRFERTRSVLEYACSRALLSQNVGFEVQNRALEVLGIDAPLTDEKLKSLPARPEFWPAKGESAEKEKWYAKVIEKI